MRYLVAVAVLSSVLSACGSNVETTSLESNAFRGIVSQRELDVLHGSIVSVQPREAEGPGVAPSTEVSISYQVPCTHTFEKFSYVIRNRANGEVEILTSAFATAPILVPGQLVCESIEVQMEKIALPGSISADKISLVSLKGEKTSIPSNISGFATAIGAEVVGATPLCPNSEKCLVDGTMITLRTHVGCVDSLGALTFLATQTAEGQMLGAPKLAVSALNFVNRLSMAARCERDNTIDTLISAPNFYGSVASIELTVLR